MTRLASEPLLPRRRAIAVFAAMLLAVYCPPVVVYGESPTAACDEFRVRPQDEIWLVDTRCLGCPEGKDSHAWAIWKYEPKEPRWLSASAEDFYNSDLVHTLTSIYVHGNRVSAEQATSDGLDVYFELIGKFDDLPPVRFVIWSWPSDQIPGQLRDVRMKADRADSEAYYLARFIADMHPDVKVGLTGFSFGARIIAGNLHLLGGGTLAGMAVPGGQRQLRAALWAAAEHDDWLHPGEYHGQALALADRWFIAYNCCDPALALYRFIDSCKSAVAMGYSGVCCRHLLPPELDQRIEEMDASHIAGRTHTHEPYLYCSPIIDRTRATVLWLE
jgi:hypothetical protein